MCRGSACRIEIEDVGLSQAMEMARVGVIPSDKHDPVGSWLTLGGQRFVVVGHANKDEFLEAIENAGLDRQSYENVPDSYMFLRISTD